MELSAATLAVSPACGEPSCYVSLGRTGGPTAVKVVSTALANPQSKTQEEFSKERTKRQIGGERNQERSGMQRWGLQDAQAGSGNEGSSSQPLWFTMDQHAGGPPSSMAMSFSHVHTCLGNPFPLFLVTWHQFPEWQRRQIPNLTQAVHAGNLTINFEPLWFASSRSHLPHPPQSFWAPSTLLPPLWSMEWTYISPSTVNLQFTSCCSRNKGPTSSVSCKGLVPTYYKSHPHSVHVGRWLLPHIFIRVQFTLAGGISRAISLLCRWWLQKVEAVYSLLTTKSHQLAQALTRGWYLLSMFSSLIINILCEIT